MVAFLLEAMLISVSGVMSPGPVTAVAVGRGSESPHAGALVAIGHGMVEFPLMAAVAWGFGRLVRADPVRLASALIGGILLQTEGEIVRKIPLLGDIPLLGGLFRHTATRQINTELLAFITPHVLTEPEVSPQLMQELDQAQQKLKDIREQLEGPPYPPEE